MPRDIVDISPFKRVSVKRVRVGLSNALIQPLRKVSTLCLTPFDATHYKLVGLLTLSLNRVIFIS